MRRILRFTRSPRPTARALGLVLIGAGLAACNPPGGPADETPRPADAPPASQAPPGTRDAGQGADPGAAPPPAPGETARSGAAGEAALGAANAPGQAALPSAEQAAARAELEPTEGSSVSGTVEFSMATDGLLAINADISGMAPGAHGIHIHELGDCSAPDGSSAGEHFAPGEDAHGAPSDPAGEHHAGDLGNVVANESGDASHSLQDDELGLDGPLSVVGRAVVVHAGEDDLVSQPDGNSGSPVACGVIRRVARGVG